MVQKFNNFINENKSTDNILYSALTALCIMNPNFFNFLEDNKNRYQLNSESFWQSFIYELKNYKNIKMSKDHIMDIKGLSIEKDWSKLKKCVKASNKISIKFNDIKEIKITSDNQIILINNDNISKIRSKKDVDKIKQKDLENLLGFNSKDILSDKYFDLLTEKWLECLEYNLIDEYKKYLSYFTDKLSDKKYKTFSTFKVNGLGIKIEEFPKLYYSTLVSFCKDILDKKEAFRDYDEFLYLWYNIKNEILNGKILSKYINNLGNKNEEFKNITIKYHSLCDEVYFRFDKSLELIEMPTKQSFIDDSDINLNYNFKANINKDLIVEMINGNLRLKTLIKMNNIYPSPIKIKSKYVKR